MVSKAWTIARTDLYDESSFFNSLSIFWSPWRERPQKLNIIYSIIMICIF